MSIKLFRKIIFGAALVLSCNVVSAQDGAYSSYSPYSVFGVGDIARQGTAYNKSMGGVGIASRNNRFINYLNWDMTFPMTLLILLLWHLPVI